ncbi:B12-binding domain-containing radical SAM protein [Kitasatospora sp. NPDC058201]|uniref:B12-binding domain-containing radical SAM protein n=1 Tax=Streptomycetaceae TaxID=2062 RepID=UPI002E78F4A8|nr:radical SAM protein [Streptomyces sp. BE303]MED7953435.1 radical SAM protein [Streptomyces sp. BE303]
MRQPIDIDLSPAPPRKKPGEFAIALDPRITDPGRFKVSFLILLDGDLVMSPEHLGVAYMTSVLRSVGFTAEIREVDHDEDAHAATVEHLRAYRPDLVCFTLMSLNLTSCVSLCRQLKEALPDTPIACGGPAGTFAGLDVLRNNPYTDLVAVGEGEPTILDLVQRLYLDEALTDCPGICYRDADGALRQNPARPLIHDLEVLPFPARDQLSQHGDKLEYVRVSTSRGCVANCAFCSAPHLKNRVQAGKAWRGRGPEQIVEEVAQIVERHQFRTFDFVDSTFEDPDGGRVGKKRAAAIAQGMLDRGLDIYYNVCMRAENWSDTPEDHALLDLLTASGLEKVNVGIEAGTAEELLLWEKRATVEDNVTIIRMLREHGIYLAMGFIPFHPYATLDTLIANARFLRDNSGHNLRRMTERLEIYPGTAIVRRIEGEGLLWDSYQKNLDPYGYDFADERVGLLAKHFARLYNNDDYHQRGVITDQSAVFEFETYNVVMQTFISRLHRRFGGLPGVDEVMEDFKATVHEIRQEMGQFNYGFFMSNLEAVMNDSLDRDKQEVQVVDVEEYFRDRLDRLRSEQLRVGKRLTRLGARVMEISSTLPSFGPGGLPRSYSGEGSGATW